MNQPKLSLTETDFKWEYFPVGTLNVVRCFHEASGAEGEGRFSIDNKRRAFELCVQSEEFRIWSRKQISIMEGRSPESIAIEDAVDREMRPENIKIQTHGSRSRWIKNDMTRTTERGHPC